MEVPLYFYVAYENMERLSPGSDEVILNAIEKTDLNKDDELNILDIACAKGTSTLLLADYFKNSTVEAVDLFKHYLKELDEKIANLGLSDRVYTYQMDMNDLDFANEEFDIVFCHAAIEIMGFKKGLREWMRLLKSGGYLIVSDITWLKKPSSESRKFWKNTYSEVDTLENKVSQIENEGYKFIGHVNVAKNDWIEYYSNLKANLNRLKSDKSAKSFTSQLKKEMNVFRNNSDDYSYVFYICRMV